MTEILKRATATTQAVRGHVSAALDNLEEFRLLGINAAGILLNPLSQRATLAAAREALDKAVAHMDSANWPSEEDYHAL